MKVKAVIFDLDGFLMDSEPLWGQADTQMLEERGIIPTEETFRKRLGTGNTRTVEIYKEDFGLSDSIEDLAREREELFFRLLDQHIPPMEGEKDLAKSLVDKGIKLAIATSGPHRERKQRILDALGLASLISVFVTGEEVQKAKPDPEIFLTAAHRLGVDPADCLVFEDAPSGIEAAKAARMMAVGVNRDAETRSQLKEKGADEVFSSLPEINIVNFLEGVPRAGG